MTDDDLIVVDDVEEHHAGPSSAVNGVKNPPPQPQPPRTRPLRAAAEQAMATTLRLRGSPEASDRATRLSTAKLGKPQPKLRIKLSERAAAQAPGMSFLGSYDRELDSDDEDLTFEEQFIIRMPPGEDCERLRKMIQSREISNDVWFKFKGASEGFRGAFASLGPTRRQTPDGVSFTSATRSTRSSWSICLVSSKPKRRLTTSKCSRWQTFVRCVFFPPCALRVTWF